MALATIDFLKVDLQISSSAYDEYLRDLISFAEKCIETEGITLDGTSEDNQLVGMYAAYLYRKRKEQATGMPRYLRYALNNRLLSEKARAVE